MEKLSQILNRNLHNWDCFQTGDVLLTFLSATSYTMNCYNFGMAMPGRQFNSSDYRFGFNGMEKDDEIKGSGNSYTTFWRQYDPRIGRWLTPDPLMDRYAAWSPYNFNFNNPINLVDPYGNGPGEEKDGKARADKAKSVDQTDNRSYKQVSGDASKGDDYVDCSEFCREIAGTQDYDPGRDSRSQSSYYQKNGEYSTDVKDVQVGDFVFWKSKGGSKINHTGVVTEVNEDGSFTTVHATVNKSKPGSIKSTETATDGSLWGGSKVFVGTGRPKLAKTDAKEVQAESQQQTVHKTNETVVPETATSTSATPATTQKPATSSGSSSSWFGDFQSDWNQFWGDLYREASNPWNWTGR